jgi:hypothetical protein
VKKTKNFTVEKGATGRTRIKYHATDSRKRVSDKKFLRGNFSSFQPTGLSIMQVHSKERLSSVVMMNTHEKTRRNEKFFFVKK